MPFQEGYEARLGSDTHAFTDYRWNDGTVVRRWMIDPRHVDHDSIELRRFVFDDPFGDN